MRVRKNYLWVVVALIVIVGGIVTAILLRKRAAPDAVRLLPNSDAVLYINLEPIRLLTDLGKNPPKERDPQYEDFVRQTGFEFERDLDKAAFAIHYGVPTGGKPAESRYSEILQGHFDSTRVADYLRKLASSTEHYHDYDIYVIPHRRPDRARRTAWRRHCRGIERRQRRRDSRHDRPLQAGGASLLRIGPGQPVLQSGAAGQHCLDNRASSGRQAAKNMASCWCPADGVACCRATVWSSHRRGR